MKYLGIDFGLKRVGLATSDGSLASPYKIIEVRGFKDTVSKILEIVKGEGFEKIVVGLPEGKIGEAVLRFAKAFKKIGLEVEFADETLSSKIALDKMIELNFPKKRRKFNDEMAAVIILQNFLDSQK